QGSNRYQGTYTAFANTALDKTFEVTVTVVDSRGARSSAPCGQVVVAGVPVVIRSCSVTPALVPARGGQIQVKAELATAPGVVVRVGGEVTPRYSAEFGGAPGVAVRPSSQPFDGHSWEGTAEIPSRPDYLPGVRALDVRLEARVLGDDYVARASCST